MTATPDTTEHGAAAGAGVQHARTLVIIPAFNEQEALPDTLHGLLELHGDLDVVVVDDGSLDRTAEVAIAAGVTVLRLPFNLGIGGALRTGFRYAVAHGYERAVQFDADGQHDPDSIETLLAGLDHGADLVIGSRFTAEDHLYRVSRVRAGAMGLLRVILRQLSGERLTDTSSGFRAFSSDMLEFFATTYPVEYMESVEALLMASAEGFAIREVPVRMHPRRDGTPSNHRLKLLYHYLRLLLVVAVSAPGRQRREPRP